MDGQTERFTDFIARYENGFNGGDFTKLLELWSPDCEEPWYQPEEFDEPLIGWPALEKYVASLSGTFESFELKTVGHRTKSGPADSLLFMFTLYWRGLLKGAQAPIASTVQASGLLHEHFGELKLLHYAESGPSALPFVRKAYVRQAGEGVWST